MVQLPRFEAISSSHELAKKIIDNNGNILRPSSPTTKAVPAEKNDSKLKENCCSSENS